MCRFLHGQILLCIRRAFIACTKQLGTYSLLKSDKYLAQRSTIIVLIKINKGANIIMLKFIVLNIVIQVQNTVRVLSLPMSIPE